MAESYVNLGAASYFYGAFDGAIDYYEKALDIRIKKLGKMHPYTALCYFGLGGAYYSKGEYDEAIDYVDSAVAIQQAALGEDHPDLAKSYIVLGQAYRSKGEFDRAVGYFQKALAIQSKTLGEANPDLAHGYDNLGSTYDSEGDYDQAIAYYRKALAIRLKVLGEGHLDVAESYVSLANAYYAEGDCDRAIDFDEKAVAIQLRAVGEDNPLVAQSYNNLGVAFGAKGEGDRAIDDYEKALAIQLKTLGAEHPNVALSYENLGKAWYSKGESERAIDYEEKALALARKSADRQLRLQIARDLGIMELQLGSYEKAKRAFLEGVAVIEEARGETGGGKAEFMARNISVYYLSLEASAALKDISGVFDAAEAMRARGFLDRLSLSAALFVDGVPPESRAKMLTLSDQLESLARRRSAEIQKAEAQQDKEALLSIVNELQAAEKEFSDLDRSLMGIARYKELRNPNLASLDDAQKLLDGSQAILEYVLREEEGQRQAWCLVIRNTGTELVRLDETFDFSGTVADFRQAILHGDVGREGIGERLYEKIIAPVKDRLSGAEKIIIVPDGALAFLPFDALRKDASSPYMAEDYEMSLAPSVSVLRMVAGRAYGGREQRWLAFGGALYSREGSGAQLGRRELAVVKALGDKEKEYSAARGAKAYFAAKGYEWSDLPGTRSEVLAIDQSVYAGAGTRVLLGADASARMVKRLSANGELERQRVLHFACHGIFDPDFPAYSAVVLSEVSGEVEGSSAEEGYLTVEDVAKLRLKADMVELSACETGLGKVVQGDGVIGLARAFMVAGANGVGTTLWVVDDIATRDFMVRVYGLVVKEGMSFAAAMAETKREFIKSKDYSDPYYWSPFAMYGN